MGTADAKFASYPPSPLKLPVTDKAMSCTSSFDLPGSKLHHPSPANPYQSMAAYTTEATFPHSYPTSNTHSSAFAMKQNGEYTDSYGGYSSAMQGLKSQVSGMSGTPVSGQQSLGHSWPFYGLSSRSMTSQMTSERSPHGETGNAIIAFSISSSLVGFILPQIRLASKFLRTTMYLS